MFCPHCGERQPDGTAFCGSCGQRITDNVSSGNQSGSSNPFVGKSSGGSQIGDGNPFVSQSGGNQFGSGNQSGGAYNPYGNNPPPPPNNFVPPHQNMGQAIEITKAESNATKAMVFGILSLICGGVLWTVLAAVFGFMAVPTLKRHNRPAGKAIAGIVMGFAGLIFWSIVMAVMIAFDMMPF